MQLPIEVAEVIFFTSLPENVAILKTYGINAEQLCNSFLVRAKDGIRRKLLGRRTLKLLPWMMRYSSFETQLVRRDVDLVYFLSPSGLPSRLDRLNFIITVWDLCHLDEPEFPEVRWNHEQEIREIMYGSGMTRALAIFVDSPFGKRNIASRYRIDERRIHVMPFQAANGVRHPRELDPLDSLRIRERYQLDVPYVFYPAQFWAHKNHVYLLEGLHALERLYGIRVGAIFSGADKGNRSHVEKCAHKLGLHHRVRYAGFVSNDEILALYRQSVALVMPTYFGPTNLPPLEAFHLGVPVLYPDRAGLRDQVGDAALLMDLQDPISMAVHMRDLIEDLQLRDRLVKAGYERLKDLEGFDRMAVLLEVIEEFRWKRSCWG